MRAFRALRWCPQVDGTGKYLIISGPPTTDPAVDHPMTGRFALWSWEGGTSQAVLRIPDLASFCRYPTGVATFTVGGQARIIFAQRTPASLQFEEQGNLIHWPLSILKPLPPPAP